MTLVDRVRIHDDVGFLRLAEDLGQLDGRNALRGDDVAQEIARPDRRQLVRVADQNQTAGGRKRPSPTSTSRAPCGSASMSACISRMSTMDTSSRMTASHSSGLVTVRA